MFFATSLIEKVIWLDGGGGLLHRAGHRLHVLGDLVVGGRHLHDRRRALLGALVEHLDVLGDAPERGDHLDHRGRGLLDAGERGRRARAHLAAGARELLDHLRDALGDAAHPAERVAQRLGRSGSAPRRACRARPRASSRTFPVRSDSESLRATTSIESSGRSTNAREHREAEEQEREHAGDERVEHHPADLVHDRRDPVAAHLHDQVALLAVGRGHRVGEREVRRRGAASAAGTPAGAAAARGRRSPCPRRCSAPGPRRCRSRSRTRRMSRSASWWSSPEMVASGWRSSSEASLRSRSRTIVQPLASSSSMRNCSTRSGTR